MLQPTLSAGTKPGSTTVVSVDGVLCPSLLVSLAVFASPLSPLGFDGALESISLPLPH
jgi:hypothetical protein